MTESTSYKEMKSEPLGTSLPGCRTLKPNLPIWTVKKTKRIHTSINYKSPLLPPPLTKINAGKSTSDQLKPSTPPSKNATKREMPTWKPRLEEMTKTKFWMKLSESLSKKSPAWTTDSETELTPSLNPTLKKEVVSEKLYIFEFLD